MKTFWLIFTWAGMLFFAFAYLAEVKETMELTQQLNTNNDLCVQAIKDLRVK